MAVDATTEENTPFNVADLDWDEYHKFRPSYPPALYSIIYAYHTAHSNTFDSAIDIGAGAGIVSNELSKKFSHVTVTDPASAYVAAAKAYLKTASPNGNFDFLKIKAEDLTVDVLPKKEKVDFVAAAECMHWTNAEVAAPRIANVLKPGGTFAAWLYGPRPIVDAKDQDVGKAYDAILDMLFLRPEITALAVDHSPGDAAISARLNNMPLDPALWTSVRRIHNNLDQPMAPAKFGSAKAPAASRVTEHESIETCDDELLSQEADYEYLEGYLSCLTPMIKVREVAKEELQALKKIMQDRTVRVRWPFVLILATRR